MLVLSQLIFPFKLYLFLKATGSSHTQWPRGRGKAATSTSAFSFLNGLALMLLGYKMATTKLPYQLKTGNPFSFESEDYHSDPLHGSEKRDFQKSSLTCEYGCIFRSRPEPKQVKYRVPSGNDRKPVYHPNNGNRVRKPGIGPSMVTVGELGGRGTGGCNRG